MGDVPNEQQKEDVSKQKEVDHLEILVNCAAAVIEVTDRKPKGYLKSSLANQSQCNASCNIVKRP
jgi:hypothetical protein